MHEYPVTLQIIEIAEKHARDAGANQVKHINLVVGDYCGYVSSSIELYFPIIAESTLCENATLHIERVKPMLRCNGCGYLFERKAYSFTCPECGGEGEMSEVGKEFYVKSIEIE